jgi:hypothetical protein
MIKLQFILSFALISNLNLYSYEDLGTYGQLYDIKEKDFTVLLEEKYSEVNRAQLKNDIYDSAKKSLKVNSNLSTCIKSQLREFEPIVNLDKDIIIPYSNETIARSGKYNILEKNNLFMPYNIIFIDANDELQVELAKIYKENLKEKIRVLVAKGDYLKLSKDELFTNSKIARESFELKAFNVQCLPSIYTQKNYSFFIQELNPKELKNEDN